MGWNKIAAEMLESIETLQNDDSAPEFWPYGRIYQENSDARALLAYFLQGPHEGPVGNEYNRALDYAAALNEWCERNMIRD